MGTSAAINYFPMFLFFAAAFSGFVIHIPQFPLWLRVWAPYISFLRYPFQGLCLNEFTDNSNLPGGQYYISELGFNLLTINECGLIQWVFIVLLAVMSVASLKYIDYEE